MTSPTLSKRNRRPSSFLPRRLWPGSVGGIKTQSCSCGRLWGRCRLVIVGFTGRIAGVAGEGICEASPLSELIFQVAPSLCPDGLQLRERNGIGSQLWGDSTAKKGVVEINADLGDVAWVESDGHVLPDVSGENG